MTQYGARRELEPKQQVEKIKCEKQNTKSKRQCKKTA